ncbi:uncharacterized protein A4U43_C07F39650 [Asparagus officinalis]|uniref:NADH dehydrogenase [ubiquinone] 1 alpha subcomplex subunit 12 n=1 Tax=Asparagus officinalis TaxID=4686 RepID=A0A5P1EIH5_ASPOF|nr:uncharacterized protein A4U43_C07F39650 [Asparagus officinalis]
MDNERRSSSNSSAGSGPGTGPDPDPGYPALPSSWPGRVRASTRQTKIHNIGATLVGVDKFGNKYYEKLENTQYGRHRWVEYADKGRYNASQVPAEWHGWLHFVTDHTGDELLMLKPQRYGLEHKQNFSGEGEQYIYHSKGHTLNPGQRDWTRYQPWQPAKTS